MVVLRGDLLNQAVHLEVKKVVLHLVRIELFGIEFLESRVDSFIEFFAEIFLQFALRILIDILVIMH